MVLSLSNISIDLFARVRTASSAYIKARQESCRFSGMLFVRRRNSTHSSTDPLGTPLFVLVISELAFCCNVFHGMI